MMFKDARAQDRQLTAARFADDTNRYAATEETWFDGSVGSVERRLGQCIRLIHTAQSTVARLPLGHVSPYLKAAEKLEADRRALHSLREDMLTGASSREDAARLPSWRTASKQATHNLEGSDRRWVELEAARFVAEQRIADSQELATRAAHHAEVKTSTFTKQRSAAITRAFVARVVDLGSQAYVPATARTAAVDVDFDPQALFLM